MDSRKVLPFLLLMACVISVAFSFKNGFGHGLIRRTRKISLNEYLVPPPLPKFHPSIRTGRLAAPQPVEGPGYFDQLISWLNPFNYGFSSQPSEAPPQSETLYSSLPKYLQPPPPLSTSGAQTHAKTSDDSLPPIYDRLPPPLTSNNHQIYSSAVKNKNCNPCDKVPWVPMKHGELSYSKDESFISPPPSSSPQFPPLNEGYPLSNAETAHDAYQAASQEIRVPDFSLTSPLSTVGQDGHFIHSLLNPHMYPGAIPPLFKATDFNHPVRVIADGNSEYLNTSPVPIFGNGSPTNNSFTEPNFNRAHDDQPIYSNPSGHSDLGVTHQESVYSNPSASNGERFYIQNYKTHEDDLSSSGIQVSGDHATILGKQKFEDTAIYRDPSNINHQTSFNSVSYHQSSGLSNKREFDDITLHGLLDDSLDNSSQIDQNSPSSYGTSGFNRIPNNDEYQYNDLSTSDSIAKDSHASLQTSDGSSAKIENPIHFETSPLLDLTHKGESRTDSSSIPLTSNAFADFNESAEIAGTDGTTLTPNDEFFEIRQNTAAMESHSSASHLQTITDPSGSFEESEINGSVTQNSKTFKEQQVSHVSSNRDGYLWSNILSTVSSNTEIKPLSTLVKSYDDVKEDESNHNIDINLRDTNKTSVKQDVKRSKQVQLIIPYTLQYTPLPFHPSHKRNYDQKVSYTGESNSDNYVSKESQNRIKVTNFSSSSHASSAWSTASKLEDVTGKPADIKVNNSIDVHRLQKNIDNWTIQEYSKGTTASTVSVLPSSANPYLFPSKQIPDKYLTTTESVDHITNSHDNVKNFALTGFSFNDLEHEGSASNRVEGSRIQVPQREDSKSTLDTSTDAAVAPTKDDFMWQGFSVDISPVNNERVYVVTAQPITTSKSNLAEQKKEQIAKETERSLKESTKITEIDIKKIKKKTNTFESIEQTYQVLPEAVNNLAVASTGPESVHLWGLMEHENITPFDFNEQDNKNNRSFPVLYAGHSKVSRARR